VRALSYRVVAILEPRIRDISRQLLDAVVDREVIDLALDYSVPLPMKVIAEMIGMPASDWPRFKQWSDCILQLSHARSGSAEENKAVGDFIKVTAEMSPYLAEMTSLRKESPNEDLLSRLVHAEVDGERLSHDEILGFFQLQQRSRKFCAIVPLCSGLCERRGDRSKSMARFFRPESSCWR
jgi:cytochrome P450